MNKSIMLRIVEILLLFFGLAMLFGPMKQCTSAKAMACNASTHVVEILMVGLIAVALIGIVFAVKKFKNTRTILIVLNFISSVMLFSMPLMISIIIGGCKKADMACQMQTFPFVYSFTIGFAIVNVITTIVDLKCNTSNVFDKLDIMGDAYQTLFEFRGSNKNNNSK